MSPWGPAVMGMNCVKCGTELPQMGAYCPTCGAPRREFEHLARQTERAVSQVLASGGEALGRAAKEFQPTFDRAVEALRPGGEVLERATDDVLLAGPAPGGTPTRGAQGVHGQTRPARPPPGHPGPREE